MTKKLLIVAIEPLVHQVEIDFGSYPVESGEFMVVDPQVLSSSHITGNIAYEAPTGKDLDELEMDVIDLKFSPGNGVLLIKASGLEGYLAGKFKINYITG